MSASVRTHQVIQLSGFPISRRVTHLTGQPRFAFAKSHAPPSASSRRSVARPALAYGFPSRWLSGEGFFQPSGSADMPGAQKMVPGHHRAPEDLPLSERDPNGDFFAAHTLGFSQYGDDLQCLLQRDGELTGFNHLYELALQIPIEVPRITDLDGC